MSYEKPHSPRSTLALGLAVVALAIAVSLVLLNHLAVSRLRELEERWLKQHDELVTMGARVERCEAVLDRALDAAAIARAVVEESKPK